MYNNQEMHLNNPTPETSKAFIADMFHYMKHMHKRVAPAVQAELQETCELGALFEHREERNSHDSKQFDDLNQIHEDGSEEENNDSTLEDTVLTQFSNAVDQSDISEEGTPPKDPGVAQKGDFEGDQEHEEGGHVGQDEKSAGNQAKEYSYASEDLEDDADSKARELRRARYN
jgi:hypothetical protein